MARRDITKRALAAAAFMAVAAGAWAGTAGAQVPSPNAAPGSSFGIRAGEYGRTTLEDDHFTYDVPAGTSVEDSVILVNHTNQPLTLRLYPADLISAEGGGFSPAQPDVPSRGVGGWARLERSTIELAPSATEEVGFELQVPDNATPGEHLGAIVASTVAKKGADGLAVETRAALIAKVRVPGRLAPELTLGPLTSTRDEDGGRTFSVTISNPGNVLLEVPGFVSVDSGGRRIALLSLSPSDTYVIPGGRTTLTAKWANPPLVGRVFAQAEVAAELDGRTTDTYRTARLGILLIPWLLVGAAAGLSVLAVLIWIGLRRRMKRLRAERRQRADLLEQVSALLAERESAGAVSRPTRAEGPPPRHRDARKTSDPRVHRSPRPRNGSGSR